MKKIAIVIGGLAFSIMTVSSSARAESDEEVLTNIEYNIGRAILKRDQKMLEAIFADDFSSYSGQPKKDGKKEWIAGSLDPNLTVTKFRYSPFDIRVFGTTAIVQGSNDDESSYKGKDSSGTYTWLDVFVRRDDRWQLIANETVKVTDVSQKRDGIWTTITPE